MWIAKLNTENNNGDLEVVYITAPTITHLYTKLYKKLTLRWIECHIYQERG